MIVKFRKILILLFLAFAFALILILLFADNWLESSSGRKQLETALSQSLGMPVHLLGEFSIRLLPSVRVMGTELLVGEPATPFVQSDSFSVEVALLPLLDRKLHVLALSAQQGSMNLHQTPAPKSSSGKGETAPFELPRIERLILEDFSVDLSGDSLHVSHFELGEFQAGKKSSLSLELSLANEMSQNVRLVAQTTLLVNSALTLLEWNINALEIHTGQQSFTAIAGAFSWQGASHLLEGKLDWNRTDAGDWGLAVSMDTGQMFGSVALDYFPQGDQDKAGARLDFRQTRQGLEFPRIELSYGDQQAAGSGCLLTGESIALDLSLASDYLNLDSIETLFSGNGSGGSTELPFDLNLVFSAREIHAAGAIVYESEIRAGKPPDCNIPLN
jgi:hypothetical protein